MTDGATGERSVLKAHDIGEYSRDYRSLSERGLQPIEDYEKSTEHFFAGDARTYVFDGQRLPTEPATRAR